MEADNILAVNIPNLITITIMAVLGGFILGMVRKGVLNAMGKNQSLTPNSMLAQ